MGAAGNPAAEFPARIHRIFRRGIRMEVLPAANPPEKIRAEKRSPGRYI